MEDETIGETEQASLSKSERKNVGREMQSLIKSAKDSKIIKQFTETQNKTRRSRREFTKTPEKKPRTSAKSPTIKEEVYKLKRSKSCCRMSIEIQMKPDKESTASDNIDVKPIELIKKRRSSYPEISPSSKNEYLQPFIIFKNDANGRRIDPFCWRCHKIGTNINCSMCPKAYHFKCLPSKEPDISEWTCSECVDIIRLATNPDFASCDICDLLQFALNRMMATMGAEPFLNRVDLKEFPEYPQYVVKPMYLEKLQNNISEKRYNATSEFENDCQWIVHNSVIFNSGHSKLTTVAKNILKVCKSEMREIEICAQCYKNANTVPEKWFVEVCDPPHMMLWAKLKGFPYWPAKAMATNSHSMVDVRFFGDHNKAWISVRDCYLYSTTNPNKNDKKKHNDLQKAIEEMQQYLKNITTKYGSVELAPSKARYNPKDEEQFYTMIPNAKLVFNNASKLKPKQPNSMVEIMKKLNTSEMQPKVILLDTRNSPLLRKCDTPSDISIINHNSIELQSSNINSTEQEYNLTVSDNKSNSNTSCSFEDNNITSTDTNKNKRKIPENVNSQIAKKIKKNVNVNEMNGNSNEVEPNSSSNFGSKIMLEYVAALEKQKNEKKKEAQSLNNNTMSQYLLQINSRKDDITISAKKTVEDNAMELKNEANKMSIEVNPGNQKNTIATEIIDLRSTALESHTLDDTMSSIDTPQTISPLHNKTTPQNVEKVKSSKPQIYAFNSICPIKIANLPNDIESLLEEVTEIESKKEALTATGNKKIKLVTKYIAVKCNLEGIDNLDTTKLKSKKVLKSKLTKTKSQNKSVELNGNSKKLVHTEGNLTTNSEPNNSSVQVINDNLEEYTWAAKDIKKYRSPAQIRVENSAKKPTVSTAGELKKKRTLQMTKSIESKEDVPSSPPTKKATPEIWIESTSGRNFTIDVTANDTTPDSDRISDSNHDHLHENELIINNSHQGCTNRSKSPLHLPNTPIPMNIKNSDGILLPSTIQDVKITKESKITKDVKIAKDGKITKIVNIPIKNKANPSLVHTSIMIKKPTPTTTQLRSKNSPIVNHSDSVPETPNRPIPQTLKAKKSKPPIATNSKIPGTPAPSNKILEEDSLKSKPTNTKPTVVTPNIKIIKDILLRSKSSIEINTLPAAAEPHNKMVEEKSPKSKSLITTNTLAEAAGSSKKTLEEKSPKAIISKSPIAINNAVSVVAGPSNKIVEQLSQISKSSNILPAIAGSHYKVVGERSSKTKPSIATKTTPEVLGPFSKILEENSQALLETFKKLFVDTLSSSLSKSTEVSQNMHEVVIERLVRDHKQELAEFKRCAVAATLEERLLAESAKALSLAEMSRSAQSQLESAKSKQWCAYCKNLSRLYCCWNTSYCNTECQMVHWPIHVSSCQQAAAVTNNDGSGKNDSATKLPSLVPAPKSNK